jgi:hypothetical protein
MHPIAVRWNIQREPVDSVWRQLHLLASFLSIL